MREIRGINCVDCDKTMAWLRLERSAKLTCPECGAVLRLTQGEKGDWLPRWDTPRPDRMGHVPAPRGTEVTRRVAFMRQLKEIREQELAETDDAAEPSRMSPQAHRKRRVAINCSLDGDVPA